MRSRRRVALILDLEWPQKRHTAVFAGTQRYATEQGWESIIDEYVADNLATRQPTEVPYDGVIGRINTDLVEQARRLCLPVVNVWFSSPAWKQMPGVFGDYQASGRLRAEHLLARGLRRFAVVSREDRASKLEVVTFRAVLGEAGFNCIGVTLPLRPTRNYTTWKKSERQIDELMDQWQLPIGVFVSIDDVGRMVAQMCHRRGWRVPQDVAIIAGWNEEAICEHPRPSLTSIEMSYERIGYEAARVLDQLMRKRELGEWDPSDTEPQYILIPPQGLVVRESTDFFAVEDELVAQAIAFIAANCHRRIGQDDVSKGVNAETRTLQSRFRRVLDRSIGAVIRQLRIERAKRELVQSDRSISEIARVVGFGEPARMNDAFASEVGVTPSEYRRQRELERVVPPTK